MKAEPTEWGWVDPVTRIVSALAALAIPIVVVAVSNSYSDSIAERGTNAQYVEMAVNILSQPKPDSEDEAEIEADSALREWAVGVLVRTSPFPLDAELQADLTQGDVNFEPVYSLAFGTPNYGPLPAECTIVRRGDSTEPIPVFGEPSSLGDVVTTLDATGEYQATEYVFTAEFPPLFGALAFYKVEAGWVAAESVLPTDACF
jgi:hypothetical protein